MRLSETKLGGEDGVYVEEGANWSGGFTGNPIVELLKDYKVEMHKQNYENYNFWRIGADDTVTKLLRKDIPWGEFYGALDCVYDKAFERIETIESLEDLNNEPVDLGMRAELIHCGWNPQDYFPVGDAVEYFNVELEYTDDPSNVGMNSFPEWSYGYDFQGNVYFVTDKDGYQQVAERYVEGIPQPMFGTNVAQVKWKQTLDDVNVAEVVTSAGNFLARKVVSTVGIGVLKEKQDFFYPTPEQKLTAMNNVFDMGLYIKVFFKFDEPFWDTDAFIFTASEKTPSRRCPMWQIQDGSGQNAASHYYHDTNIIFCILMTDDIASIGGAANINEDYIDELLEDLRDVYGTLPPYESYYKDWENDEWTYGSFENWKVGGKVIDHNTFIEPLASDDGENIVHMAGSATCNRHYGWIHGAFFSGYRAARTAANELDPSLELDTSTLCEDVPDPGFGANPFRQMVNGGRYRNSQA